MTNLGAFYRIALSRNGRFVAFEGGSQVYLNDTCLGVATACTPTTSS